LEIGEHRSKTRREPRATPRSRRFDAVVQRRKGGVELQVMHAKLEQLRVRELENVLDVAIIGTRLDDECALPREHGKVVVVV